MDELTSLNKEQRLAVLHKGGPLLLLAGAGSGKTRVITHKIAYLIKNEKVTPSSILSLTFTKKAAEEMKERAIKLNALARDSTIKTFHSFGAAFLRSYGYTAGLPFSFNIYDTEDSINILKKALNNAFNKKELRAIYSKISLCKDYALFPNDDLSRVDGSENFKNMYTKYQESLTNTKNVDFGDLILLPYLILKKNDKIKEVVHNDIKVVLVDEYQDSNVAQYMLLKELVDINSTYLSVVGDDDQSIYKFRGANISNILDFPKYFKGTTIIKLEKNYRSTPSILSLANKVIKNNLARMDKTLISTKEDKEKPILITLQNQNAEAEFCANFIKENVSGGKYKYQDFAIFYRTNAQSLTFETEFLHKNIPYEVVGALKFYEREEVKDTLSYIAFISNNKDVVAFTRILNKPARSIGERSIEKIINALEETKERKENKDISLIDYDLIENIDKLLTKKAFDNYKKFCLLIKKLQSLLDNSNESKLNLSQFIKEVLEETGLFDYYKEEDRLNDSVKSENLLQLINSSVRYEYSHSGLTSFLDNLTLDASLTFNLTRDKNKNICLNEATSKDAVTLITLHNTKGLEYPIVIMTGLENGIFPKNPYDKEELEEERRLFYVGVTRAKDKLLMTTCETRLFYGQRKPMTPCIFLTEGKGCYDINDNSFLYNSGYSRTEYTDENENNSKYKRGVHIYNDEYGEGDVIKSERRHGNTLITVQFMTGKRKVFIEEYQRNVLEIIER